MTPKNNTIVVNVKSGSGQVKKIISGNLEIGNSLQNKCEEVLRQYGKGKKFYARKQVEFLLEKYPDSIIVKHLNVLILYRDKKYAVAYKHVKQVLKRVPKHVGLINMQGLMQRQLKLFDAAIASYLLAIKLNPKFADPYNNLAIIYRYFGKKDLAIHNFRKAIALNENYCAAFYNLSCIKGYKASKDEINIVVGLLKKLKITSDVVRCHFTLYNAYLSYGRKEKAFRHLEAGNTMLAQRFAKRKPLKVYVEELKENFDTSFYKNRIHLEPFYKVPYFIVGMPRSGSSLLEQILSSHSEIYGLGESKSMTDTLLSLDSHVESNISLFTSAFDKLNSSDLNKIVENYRNKIQGEVGGLSIYTDKMLKNFKFIGFIKMLLPNAKFIHIKRHALDNCLSCYEKKFTQGHEYTYDLKMLGGYYSAYIELMEYWKSIFPEDIYEVNYEELIHDSEKVITQCLGFMNLELEKSCLEFYKSKRLVFTASTDQVRDKINTRSIGKWEKFETQLQPLIQELNANNIALD
ncbi:MAG: hypothetical protein COA71_06610 [SAR86 cluster bacterium]|uniref:DNA/RNA-binding domain-containing protein n=1 Tax=SAR86 cluster bacterium TaxID=2030880 RepID=A0A2A5CDT5_9GAMM|nr:sulfotransferase [Gammaproteobacteria bacterium AH-315-E17]PCJ41681.1 MAG: hypothetical protein COA71_06610 [SAR86 cluster bacterium]